MNYRKEIYSRYTSNFQPESRDVLKDLQVNRWGRAYDHYFRNWLPPDKNAAIVDLACGGGRLLHFLKGRGYTNLSGVDISPEQVGLAKTVTSSVFMEDILTFLGKQKEIFDLITAIDVIEHLTRDEGIQFLGDCYRSLKPGGRIVLQMPNADSPMFPSVWYHDLTHEVGYTPHSLKGLLKLAGFQLIEAREAGPVPIKFRFLTGWRFAIWKLLRMAVMTWNLVEMGNKGSGIYTRVFLVSAVKE
jgi:2-polyprenyl-3-methyl-5-hydroxy-6-metoxy-1,4-benzoquinol methylase